jgi:hypothetical protein
MGRDAHTAWTVVRAYESARLLTRQFLDSAGGAQTQKQSEKGAALRARGIDVNDAAEGSTRRNGAGEVNRPAVLCTAPVHTSPPSPGTRLSYENAAQHDPVWDLSIH